MRIRPFRREDTEAVVALWQACGLTRPWNDPYADIEAKLAVQPELFFVGTEADGTVVAAVMAGYDGHRGSVNYLAVAPDHRRQGLGAQLMAHAEAALAGRGCPKINLQVRRENQAVAGFYQRLGYEPFDIVDLGKRLDG